MADNQNCFRCGRTFAPAQMQSSPSGNVFCPGCWAEMNAQTELPRRCPVDNADMKKRLVADAVVIDVCTKCGGLWFDKGELGVIEKKSREMGWQEGFLSSIILLY